MGLECVVQSRTKEIKSRTESPTSFNNGSYLERDSSVKSNRRSLDKKAKRGSITKKDSDYVNEDSTTFSSVLADDKHKVKKSRKSKAGKIYCVCAFQSYENGMLLCIKCKSYSHA